MKKEKPTTKTCKYCKTEIPYDAKVCPQCRKKQGMGCLTKIIIFVVIIVLIGLLGSSGDDDNNTATEESTTKSTTEATTTSTTEEKTEATTEAKKTYRRKDYNPEITYNDLARTPDDYMYEKITFSGTVIQVIEDSDSNQTQLRIATKDGYDNVILVSYDSDIIKTRILEDDTVRFYGYSAGLITYESTMGGNITIPSAIVEHIKILD